jgi:hypothetical protein
MLLRGFAGSGERLVRSKKMHTTEIEIENLLFQFVCDIEPDRCPDGRIREYMPQARYKGSGSTRLNPNGAGPFCRFKIPRDWKFAGVYAVMVSDRIVYIGECMNLSVRWGLGQYGSIQPKNCYVGGQSTNCKINSRVLQTCRDGGSVQLWFHKTESYKSLEQMLRTKLHPEWNAQF